MSDCSTSAFKVPEKPKLKSCPFCGGEYRKIREHNQDCYLKKISDNFRAFVTGDIAFQHTEEAMNRAWNTRFYSLYEIKDWAFSNLECCDEPEWTLFTSIYDAVGNYLDVAEGW